MLNELIDLANDEEVPVIGSDWPKLEAQTHNCMGRLWCLYLLYIIDLYLQHSFIYCIKYRWQNAAVNKCEEKFKKTQKHLMRFYCQTWNCFQTF